MCAVCEAHSIFVIEAHYFRLINDDIMVIWHYLWQRVRLLLALTYHSPATSLTPDRSPKPLCCLLFTVTVLVPYVDYLYIKLLSVMSIFFIWIYVCNIIEKHLWWSIINMSNSRFTRWIIPGIFDFPGFSSQWLFRIIEIDCIT